MDTLLLTIAVLVAFIALIGLFCRLVLGWSWKKMFGSWWSWW